MTYYVVVDGYGTESGSYTLLAEECGGCTVECPPDAIMEGEPECHDGYDDHDNGGCQPNPIVFDTLACGESVCATTGTFLFDGLMYRDTDWYQLELAAPAILTWTVHGDFSAQGFILRAGIPEPCTGFEIIAFAVGMCSTVVTAEASTPGLYFLWAGPSVFTGIPCGTTYWAEVTCSPLQGPVGRCCYNQGADCADNSEPECGALGGVWSEGVTCAANPCLEAIDDLTVYPSGNDIVLRWTAAVFATFYRIYTMSEFGGPATLLDSVTATEYTHVNGSSGTRLFYDVRSCRQ